MKKLFTLLAMVGLAFASCTPEGGQDGPNGGGNEFTFEVTNISEYGATIAVTPKDLERTYFSGVYNYSYMQELGGAAKLMESSYEFYKAEVDAGTESWLGGTNPLLQSGIKERTIQSLKPETKYVVIAYGVDANGNLTSTTPSWKEFKTLDSTFDTSAWSSIWNVTTDKVYYELIANDKYQYGVTTIEGGYTRPIEIIDGVTEDPSLSGYALVYGWDGVFYEYPSIATETSNILPAFAKYSGNSLEFINEEIVYGWEDESFLMWIAYWDE